MSIVDNLDLATILVGVVTLLLCYVFLGNFFNGLPPGPWGLPFVGYIPWMTHNWHSDFKRLGKSYGDVFTVYIMNSPVVVLNSTKAIQEAFYKNPAAWAGRPYSHGFELHQLNTDNLFKADYTAEFRARKKFGMASLKKFGYGLPSVQETIQGEIDSTIEEFNRYQGRPFFFRKAWRTQGANPIPAILFNRRFESDDTEFLSILDDTDVWFTTMTPTCEADVAPFLKYLPRGCVKPGLEAARRLKKWFTGIIEEHRENFDPDNINCFVDACLKHDEGNKEILNYIMSFWGDGVDTIPGTIAWWVYYIAHHPACQAKAQEEIDRVLDGREALVSDKPKLPYLEATAMETMRMVTAVPISLGLKTTEDTKILGYKIPKDTNCLANWTMMHNDPDVFRNPDEFDPERFILEDGSCHSKHKGWAGFAIGKRSCIGEPVAKQEMFLFLAYFLQHFTFSFPEDMIPSKNFQDIAVPGVTNMPRDFMVIAAPRKTLKGTLSS